MRELIKQFVKICVEVLPISEPIYEFGSLQVPGQENFADLRPLFPGKKYVGVDMRKGPGVDVILNLHQIDLLSELVSTVLLLDTLEHVEFPRKAISEVHRILKPDGLFIMSSVMNFHIHDYPYDYWRFTPEGFKSLLSSFAFSFVDSIGDPKFPHTIIGVASKRPLPDKLMNEFKKQFEIEKRYTSKPYYPTWKRLLKPFIPPVVSTMYQKIKRSKKKE